MCPAPSLSSLSKVALETVPIIQKQSKTKTHFRSCCLSMHHMCVMPSNIYNDERSTLCVKNDKKFHLFVNGQTCACWCQSACLLDLTCVSDHVQAKLTFSDEQSLR